MQANTITRMRESEAISQRNNDAQAAEKQNTCRQAKVETHWSKTPSLSTLIYVSQDKVDRIESLRSLPGRDSIQSPAT